MGRSASRSKNIYMNYWSNRNYENYRNYGNFGNYGNYGKYGSYMNYGNSRKCGKMETMENGGNENWLLNVVIKFGSLMSFHENVEKEKRKKKKKNITPRDPLRDL